MVKVLESIVDLLYPVKGLVHESKADIIKWLYANTMGGRYAATSTGS